MISEIDKIRIVSDILNNIGNVFVDLQNVVHKVSELYNFNYDCYSFCTDIMCSLVDSGYILVSDDGTEIKRSDKLWN